MHYFIAIISKSRCPPGGHVLTGGAEEGRGKEMRMQLAIFLMLALFMAGLPFLALYGGGEPVDKSEQGSEDDPPTPAEPSLSEEPKPGERVFRIADRESGEVREVSASEFILGAIAAEMPPTFHLEALKAQGLAAYTYALKCQQQRGEGDGPDFVADPASALGYLTTEQMKERYGEQFEEYYAKLSEAARAVTGKVIVYEKEPIVAAWHAISSGRTEAAENVWSGGAAYLAPVDSSFDQNAPEFSTAVTFTAEEARERIARGYPAISLQEEESEWFSVVSRTESGNVQEILVGDHLLTGAQVRSLFGLRSANFGVLWEDGEFCFDVAGYGHDVGLSQYGADYLARQGMNCEEIIKYYYTGVEIVDESTLED